MFEASSLNKKSSPRAYLDPELSYYVLEFQEDPFSRTPLNGRFCSKNYEELNISLTKKNMCGLLKQPVDLSNLITSLITCLFKLLELLLEPYSK